MALTIEFLYENGDPVKAFNNEVLDEEKIQSIIKLNVHDIIPLGTDNEKQEYLILKINRSYVTANYSEQDDDQLKLVFTVKAIQKKEYQLGCWHTPMPKQHKFLEEELVHITKKLRKLDKEQEQLLQWALKGFPEDTVVKENEKINSERIKLQREIQDTEEKLKQARDSHIDFEKVEDFCKIASHNLADFGYDEKKQALETMKVKVTVDDNNLIRLEGIIPVSGEVCTVSQPS